MTEHADFVAQVRQAELTTQADFRAKIRQAASGDLKGV